MSVDTSFVLAILAFGWGLSLATYRMLAQYYGWPMGKLQAEIPVIPVLLGLACVTVAFVAATARGSEAGGWLIIAAGLSFAVFWTGFLRVASQTSLFLGPVAAIVLVALWLAPTTASKPADVKNSLPSTFERKAPATAKSDQRALWRPVGDVEQTPKSRGL